MQRILVASAGAVILAAGLSGCGYIDTGGPTLSWGVPSRSGATSAPPPSAPVDMCSVLSAAVLSAASGRTFDSSKTFNTPNSWGCVYSESGHPYSDWEVAIHLSYKGEPSDPPYLLLGGSDQVKPVDGLPYPAMQSKYGAMLQWGKDVVLVDALSDAKSDLSDTHHYVAAAEAAIAAIH